ncbi:hypothetical protein FQN57_005937 [Myotisia sp. PD_48]|nr:hypothetical protein FQN57_005937 [Myotisia sp. PD_48]
MHISHATADQPSSFWRFCSSMTMLQVAALCRGFLYGLNSTEVNGQEAFLELLESRRDHTSRTRGLITGLFQPTLTQAIRLLSRGPFLPSPHDAPAKLQKWSLDNVCVDPFSEVSTAFTTNGEDAYLAPSAYACNSYSWIHIFPEGMIHQSPEKTMRYFKWGVSRLILEATDCPDVVPMWIEGTDEVMDEERTFPRFLPRAGKKISVTFGDKADSEAVFGELRKRWRKLKEESERGSSGPAPVGVLNEELMFGKAAVDLRLECTQRVRELVLEVRRSRGLPDEDPRASLAETWARLGPRAVVGKQEEDLS